MPPNNENIRIINNSPQLDVLRDKGRFRTISRVSARTVGWVQDQVLLSSHPQLSQSSVYRNSLCVNHHWSFIDLSLQEDSGQSCFFSSEALPAKFPSSYPCLCKKLKWNRCNLSCLPGPYFSQDIPSFPLRRTDLLTLS